MNDKISIQSLEVRCIIGTLPRERRNKQKLLVDLEFPVSVRKTAQRDSLRDAVNYKKIADRVTAFASRSRFYLIETLAEDLAKVLLKEFQLKKILLRISKPGALKNARNVAVEIQRP
jgi:dihydroneopterin aldolase